MIVTYKRVPGTPLTKEQIAEIEEAKRHPLVFDEDCPPSTPEQLQQFRRVHPRPSDRGAAAK